jgi:ABC-type multidrug transport system fused ATPase/permease subunit
VRPSNKDSARKYLVASAEGKDESPKKKEDKK